ncbi:hypothetical protein DM860_010782 [Cuscuta australis]|uniref:Uncharacterized protein n=1 Tax=Cuscuta australis TaxID=267555 RepID=A0A328E1B1_9ASTE|nr:hypothetical protein DM860_010782 [Cuscuta australis]
MLPSAASLFPAHLRKHVIDFGGGPTSGIGAKENPFVLGFSRAERQPHSTEQKQRKNKESQEKEEEIKREVQPGFVLRSTAKRTPIGMKF